MQLTINGKINELNTDKISILEFLKTKSINANSIVIELNGKVLDSSDFKKIFLNNGDKMEVLKFMGGG